MATNLDLDDKLIEAARKLGKHKSKKEAVNSALLDYVNRLKQLRVLEDFGKIDFDPKYNYKSQRKKS